MPIADGLIGDDLLTAHSLHPVHSAVVLCSAICCVTATDRTINHQAPHHHAVLTEHLRQATGVDARDARHLFTLQPVGE